MYGFFRTATGEEIDLVVERGSKRIGFEFNTSSRPSLTKGNRGAVDLLGLERLFVVVP